MNFMTREGVSVASIVFLGISWFQSCGAFLVHSWAQIPLESCGSAKLRPRELGLRSAARKIRDHDRNSLDRPLNNFEAKSYTRDEMLRGALQRGAALGAMGFGLPERSMAVDDEFGSEALSKGARKELAMVEDPKSYQALAYSPPKSADGRPPPLLVVLHGAAVNNRGVWDLANPTGEHAGLAPSLLASGRASPVLADNFALVAPWVYTPAGAAAGRQSFYEEPRAKVLRFVEWACSSEGRRAGCPEVDPSRIFLFGFSDGATVAVELLTTRRFAGAVVASYGFTGTLPSKAVDRLKGIPMWVFHCADDAIFPVACSDKLVRTLNAANSASSSLVRYSRFERDQEGFTGSVRGHSTGITASRTPAVFEWLLELPALN